ncbi:MAG: hypothetical protein JSU68_01580 [Phycisphaerales bacterium]|nr:MAG: hypothetical protein JSU68_01580 [Phycisphaerales bacterium]
MPSLMLSGVNGVIEELETHKDEIYEKPFGLLRESLTERIRELCAEGSVGPQMFVDKPVNPYSVVAGVQQHIGS